MSITWENNLNLDDILARVKSNVIDALAEGADLILARADELVPKVSGTLAASGAVKKDRGGVNTVAIVYDSVYSHWVDQHDTFAHPHGGQSRFLEMGMIEKEQAAIQKTGEVILDRL